MVRVPRELLERLSTMELDTTPRSIRLQDELRALLSEQPQATAAQSAPVGGREAVAYEHWKVDMEPYGFSGLDAFQAGAAWQRTQSAPPASPEGREYPRYVCRKCKQETRPPEPYKAYVLCDCGYMTSATTALAAELQALKSAGGEVRRLREALEGMLEYFPEGASDGECFAVDVARDALSASTGQEKE